MNLWQRLKARWGARQDDPVVDPDQVRLHELLYSIYSGDEGVSLWLAHADRQGWSMQERLERAESLATGAYV